jgi:hypothetical protein
MVPANQASNEKKSLYSTIAWYECGIVVTIELATNKETQESVGDCANLAVDQFRVAGTRRDGGHYPEDLQ